MLGPLEDALRRRDLMRQDREDLTVVHRNSLRLLKLVNALLDFSRVEAGRVQAVYRATDLAALTAELASNFRSACDRAGLRLSIECESLPELHAPLSNFGRAAPQSMSVLICLGLAHAPSFLTICSIPSFGIAKFAVNVCSPDTNKNTNKSDGWDRTRTNGDEQQSTLKCLFFKGFRALRGRLRTLWNGLEQPSWCPWPVSNWTSILVMKKSPLSFIAETSPTLSIVR